MIIIKLKGGLGNQMFQYAFGYALGEKKNAEIRYDLSFYEPDFTHESPRKFCLDVFKLERLEILKSKPLSNDIISRTIRTIERTFLPYYKRSYVIEQGLEFDPDMFLIKKNCYLDGYWQSYKYFKDVSTAIKRQFNLKLELGDLALQWKKKIVSAENSVSLHVRRTDYITLSDHIFYAQTIDYYNDASQYIKSKTNTFTIFIFSDDINWCKENLSHLQNVIFVEQDGIPDYEIMLLMSYCQHHIIANSTYSWWGAWLAKKSPNIVIAPKMWFKNKIKNDQYLKSICPEDWVMM